MTKHTCIECQNFNHDQYLCICDNFATTDQSPACRQFKFKKELDENTSEDNILNWIDQCFDSSALCEIIERSSNRIRKLRQYAP